MAWIKTIAEDEATGVVKKYYDGNKRSWGGVDNIIKGFGPIDIRLSLTQKVQVRSVQDHDVWHRDVSLLIIRRRFFRQIRHLGKHYSLPVSP